jgi:hypothetical protein
MTKNSPRTLAVALAGLVVVGIGVSRAEGPGPNSITGGTMTYLTANPSHCVITIPRPMVPGPGGDSASITWQDDTGHETGGWPGGPHGCVVRVPKP